MNKRTIFRAACLMLGSIAIATAAPAAEPWPTRPVRLIVPFSASGTADLLARVVAEKLGTSVRPVVRHREPARCRRHYRPGAGRALGAGRLHARHLEPRQLRHQSGVHAGGVRSVQGFHPHRLSRRSAGRDDGEQGSAVQDAWRACRLREGASRRGTLRHHLDRLADTTAHRNVPARGRHHDDSRAVSRRRPDRRPMCSAAISPPA